ncbi:MAG: substrate-binding domain-containing protein [Chromatiales bacterium]|nr:substrate-binding domain-containing protein [Chromatiales bacterium]
MYIYTIARVLVVIVALTAVVQATERRIVLASTTSADNSGLYDYLLPRFTATTGIRVDVIAAGTGRALKIAEQGDADLLIVHDEQSELAFVNSGYGIDRCTFMYNDYVLVGAAADNLSISNNPTTDIAQAMQIIATNAATFISRGDDSGTHKKELALWALAGVDITAADAWYREVGAGMGATLNIANELSAYTLADRSTWISFNNRDNLVIVKENDPLLYNYYSVILVNPKRWSKINSQDARSFYQWLLSPQSLELIKSFNIRGLQLFYPLKIDHSSEFC